MDKRSCAELIQQRLALEPAGRTLRTTLYLSIRQLVLDGALPSGAPLPPTRVLADALGVGRSTLVRVYAQLRSEGYLHSRGGSATLVSETPPVSLPTADRIDHATPSAALSQRGQDITRHAASSRIQGGAFVPGVPDVSLFPFPTWRRLLAKNVRYEQRHLARYSQGGYGPLKVALAEYLRVSRMMVCAPQQILILNGSHQAIDLCARMLCDPGDRVWMEDPGYWGARNVLRASGLSLAPVPVDAEGINPPDRTDAAPRLIFVSPSSQYPTGVVMSLARRRRLLSLAEIHDAWIIEDDYDNEITQNPHPLGALFGQSPGRRVLYLGTFSKVMFPGLRLAYLVVPEQLAEPFSVGNAELYREGRMIEQAALAEFLDGGHLSAHLKRMRSVYQERREVLHTSIESRLGDLVSTTDGLAGLQLPYFFRDQTDDVALAREALEAGIVFRPLSMYYDNLQHYRAGMVLGFAAVPTEDIDIAAARLCTLVERAFSHP
ncbi:MAG: PLP-dependent aminotransferase family protein [Rhodocyclaceae bacterium]|nr:PLP-dependent aminotransferase family protein [Rhodocyclaceae bacterium]